ncbi:ABC transporter permease [Horticoccus luteus]|uniref:ABC transporter permease n=1 Tax=Horticoccus luteus TaxID=2862869 RepID=A0A8F9TU71_9BACT|nr:ABC transporter permease [Horticoccus luteus]QYM78200.1 ABC transporter permease [Horticoccus luteus]
MNVHNIFTVYRKELIDALRDRRTLLSTIIIPVLVIPLLTFGVGKIASSVINKARAETPAIAVLGGADSPEVVAQFKSAKSLKVVPAAPDWKQQITDKRLRAAVQLPEGFEAGLKRGEAPAVAIYYYEGELKSQLGVSEVENFLRTLRDQTAVERLKERGLPASLVKPFDFKRENVAPPEKVGGNMFGGIVPYLIIILCFTGAMYPAIDLTAGEKERGTMETLLCSPVARVEIVLGKFLMVLTGSISAMVFMLLSLGTTAMMAGTLFAGAGAKAAAGAVKSNAVIPMIDPLGLVGVLAMVLPVAVLFSAVIFTVALFAKSYKEAQSYVAPMMIVVIMPAVIGMLPGIDLNAQLALVPLLNLSLVCKEMLSGIWHWHYIALIFGSSCVYAGVALAVAVRMFNRESVIFRS